MHMITIKQMKEVVKQVALGMKETPMFVGQFGVGKTAGLYQVCDEMGVMVHTVLLGQYDTVDLKGTPWVGDLSVDYQATIWHPASTLPFRGNPNFPTDKPIILLLDELT